MRKTLITALALVATTSVFAQQQMRTPRPSPSATLTQAVGLTDITIKYSRPGVKGRTIWGDLVPYDKVWRTGANEATIITFSDDVTVEGQKLPKGTYSFHTIPGRDQWAVIFNSVADQWGSYSYDAAKDVVRVNVKPQAAEHAEWLTFEVPELTTDTAKIVVRWEKIAVPFTVNTDSTARTMTQFKNAMKPDWRTPYSAADFAFNNKGVATDEEVNAWVEQSLKANANIANLYLKARIAQRAGNKADAIRFGEQAIAAATAQQADFATEVRRNVEIWKK
ncbi:MAG TPA: DUF2911 domain-containing protein [Thermoanaerobaculia bacterium]|nr:DUF2911 domain-containing protein [Thermoanaerobaculia bacterium]